MEHRKKIPSKFQVKAMETYKVVGFEPNEIHSVNVRDERLDRIDGGRVRPVYYDNGTLSFSPN